MVRQTMQYRCIIFLGQKLGLPWMISRGSILTQCPLKNRAEGRKKKNKDQNPQK